MLAEPPNAPKEDRDADAHDHKKIFFPDQRVLAVSAAGFSWRGSAGLVLGLWRELPACFAVPTYTPPHNFCLRRIKA